MWVRDPDVTRRIQGAARLTARPESLPPDSGPGGTPGLRPGAERRSWWIRVKSEIRSQPSPASVVAVDDEPWRDREGVQLGTARQVGERGHRKLRELVCGLPRFVHCPVALEEITELPG
jgi:hypothetical protein